MGCYKKWSIKEDTLVVELIKSDPTNIKERLKEAAVKLNRKFPAVRSRYYSIIKNNHKIFNLIHSKPNVKNTSKILEEKVIGLYFPHLRKIYLDDPSEKYNPECFDINGYLKPCIIVKISSPDKFQLADYKDFNGYKFKW